MVTLAAPEYSVKLPGRSSALNHNTKTDLGAAPPSLVGVGLGVGVGVAVGVGEPFRGSISVSVIYPRITDFGV